MSEDIARRIFKKQIRKELLEEILQYRMGWIEQGEILTIKSPTEITDGYFFIIPSEQYKILFETKE